MNNPVNLNDPTGHTWECTGANDDHCSDNGDDHPSGMIHHNSGSDGGGSGGGIVNTVSTIIDRYKLGWENFGSALSTVKNPNAPVLFKTYSYIYITGWGSAHVALAIGVAGLACAASGPGCVTVVEGILGIGTGVSADGDPTNEIQAVDNLINTANSWPSGGSGRQIVNGVEYSSHALNQMSPNGLGGRGVPPSVVQDALANGSETMSKYDPTAKIFTTENVKVVYNFITDVVITVIKRGKQ